MSAFGYLIATLSIAAAISMLRLALAKSRLVGRLALLAPGAGITSAVVTASRSRVNRISKPKSQQIDSELPDLVELLANAILAGVSLHQALSRVSSRAHGLVADELRAMLRRLEVGSRFDIELSALCERMPTAGIREFANKLSLALARGTPLAGALFSLSETLRVRDANTLLAKAGANETKMLIPLVTLVLPTTVIFAIYPSVQFLNIGFN